MKKHAYLIMAHNEFHMLKKLLSELDDDRNDIYLHIDKKTGFVDESEMASWVQKAGIFFVHRRRIYWGHLSIVRSELDLLKAAIKDSYHYYHLLSGVDFPLKSQDEIHAFFENEDSQFVPYHRDGDYNDHFLYKVKYFFPLIKIVGRGIFDGPGKKNALMRKLVQWQWRIEKFQEGRGVDRTKKYENTEIYKGSQWFSITHDFAEFVLENKAEILKRYRLTNAPDEFFMPTLAMNSHFAERVKNTDLREIDWIRGCPYQYTVDDIDMLKASKALFARKISFDQTPELVDLLVKKIHPVGDNVDKPLISVVVPCYNVEDYLCECVDSLIAQTYGDLEILLIDDGSTDDTSVIAQKYARESEKVFYYHRENGGLSAARNTGLDISKGEYIAFVDSDDWVEPEYIEKLYASISESGADLAVCGFVKEGTEGGTISFSEDGLISSHAAMRMLGDIYPKENVLMVIAWNKLYKKSLFETVRFPEQRIHEDEFTCHRIIGNAEKIAVSTRALYHYRIREGSITASEKSQDIRHLDYLDALYERILTVRNVFYGDLCIFMMYTYFEGMKQLMIRYSDETIKKYHLCLFFRKKAAYVYYRYFGELDSFLKKDCLKLILFPGKYRREVIREFEDYQKNRTST